MVWLIAIGCLALGVIVGALTANRLGGTPGRMKELESHVKRLEERHDQYKDDVSEHFNVTADLVQHLTQSYRDVYQHLATGAQDLCTAEVANKLLPAGADAVFESAPQRQDTLGFNPPKDYATKQSPDQKGALAEDFGLEKARPEEMERTRDTLGESDETPARDQEAEKAGSADSNWQVSEQQDHREQEAEPESEPADTDQPSAQRDEAETRAATGEAPAQTEEEPKPHEAVEQAGRKEASSDADDAPEDATEQNADEQQADLQQEQDTDEEKQEDTGGPAEEQDEEQKKKQARYELTDDGNDR